MLKALTALITAGAAALAVASPAAAAPICHDDTVTAQWYGGSFGAYGVDSWEFCDGAYTIVSVNYSLGPSWVYWISGTSVYLDGIYTSPEWAEITVSDGTDTDTFTLTINPW